VSTSTTIAPSLKRKNQYKGQTIFPIKVSLQESHGHLYLAAPTEKAKKEWSCVLNGKIIFSEYLHQVEESKTRPDLRLSNLLFATVDLGSIRMDNSPLSKHTITGISKAISSFEDLNVVTFSNSEFTDDLASIIAPSLKDSFIRSINFSDNHITSEGAKLIVESILENRSVETIDFSGNEIGDLSSEAFSHLISKKKISSINFEDNKFTHEGAKNFPFFVRPSQVDHPPI